MLRNVERMNTRSRELSRINARSRTSEQAAELNMLTDQIEAARMGFGRAVHDALDGLGDTHDVAKLFLKGGRNADSGRAPYNRNYDGGRCPAFHGTDAPRANCHADASWP